MPGTASGAHDYLDDAMDDLQATAQLLVASRTRKAIYWARVRQEPITDQMLESVVRSGVWRLWGYGRLGDALMREVGLAVDRAADWTKRAIDWGCEDAKSYGR